MEKTLYTFWQLIDECTIEIPTIQRDYTYGRKTADEISTKLIGSVLAAVQMDDSSVHLDFVYGKKLGIENFEALERNKSSIDTLLLSLKKYAENLNIDVDFNTQQKNSTAAEVITFIPLDGQQRLTTLFLIYWFVANSLQNKKAKEVLQRFKYATRASSKEFLQFLSVSDYHFDFINGNLSERIENHEGFFSKWKKDPTVISMLVVLDKIQKQFLEQQLDAEKVWIKLTKENTVTFDFFDLDDFDLTDELYLKMNARGKKLTHFENFKAWLFKNYPDSIQLTDWKKKIDLEWNDLFWNEKELQDSKIDTAYLQFFKNMFLGDYLISENFSEKDENIDLLRLNVDFNPITLFAKKEIFKINIQDYLEILECFTNENVEIILNPLFYEIKDLKQFLFAKNTSLTWWHTTLHFAVTKYFTFNRKNLTYLQQWTRVISNLIYNTPIESPKLFKEAAESIVELIEKLQDKNVYEVFSQLKVSDINFFTEKQREEEILKSTKIITDTENDWESLLINLEKYHYFYGQIGFIFKLNQLEGFHTFQENALKVKLLFSEEVMKNQDYILFRSLLTYGNCFFENNNTLTYPSNIRGTLRNRNENWRRFIDNKFEYLKKLVTEINLNQPISFQLDGLINKYSSDSLNINRLIKNPELLKYPESNHIRIYDKGYYLLRPESIQRVIVDTTINSDTFINFLIITLIIEVDD